MPTSSVKLGHNQKFRIAGVVMAGTRDVEVSVETREYDVTAWNHQYVSTLPLQVDVTLRAIIYYQSEMTNIWTKLNVHPPQRVPISVDGVVSGNFVPTAVQIANPLGGVLAYDCTFKLWNYQ